MLCLATLAVAQPTDSRCVKFLGIPVEGPDSLMVDALLAKDFTPWGSSDDGATRHFRGKYYGIRGKLMVSVDLKTHRVESVYVTIGPFRSKEVMGDNFKFFLNHLRRDHGSFTAMDGSYYCNNGYGIVKISEEETSVGNREIKVFYFPTSPFYKDALMMGLHGNVMEVVTENPVAEEPMMHFEPDGRLMQADMTERNYSVYGYLTKAAMLEQSGEKSLVDFLYDDEGRLVKRTLTNKATGIRSVNEYFYNDDDEIERQVQRVYDKQERPLLSITMRNSYSDYDENDNWTKNHLSLTYWDQDNGTQQAEVEQVRTISYY